MIMQVKNTLAGVGTGIDRHPKAALGDAMIARKPSGDLKNLADDRAVFRFDIEHPGYVLARNDQKMNRRLGIDVFKDDDIIIFKNDVGFYLLGDDATEQAVGHDVLLIYGLPALPKITRSHWRREGSHRSVRHRSGSARFAAPAQSTGPRRIRRSAARTRRRAWRT